MDGRRLFEAGQLDEAIEALGVELRSDPTDARRRTFLFELLCFAGDLDRAEKQLDVLARASREAEIGAWVYRGALNAERTRREMFATGAFPRDETGGEPIRGELNGRAFESLTDADPRIGARLEVFAAGEYMWIPLAHIASMKMEQPQRLRDLIWAPVRLRTGPDFRGMELGEVLVPVLAPFSFQHAEADVRLGRSTDWESLNDGSAAPLGQKLWLLDGEELPILEVRALEIRPTVSAEA